MDALFKAITSGLRLDQIASVIIPALSPMLALIAATLIQRRIEKDVKPPQQDKLLRPAGYTLALKLDELLDSMLQNLVWASLLCCVAGISATTTATLIGSDAPVLWSGFFAVLLVAFLTPGIALTLRAFKQVKEAVNVRLGLRGEQAVAEALHELGDCGFRAFHDLQPSESWNIDHVVVGPRGVFLIETKTRSRRTPRGQQAWHVMIYDGQALQFPSGDDLKAIPQIQRNVRWLSEYLTKWTIEPVAIEPLIVVPGWYVETKGAYPVRVMNATYLIKYLRGQSEKLKPIKVQQIINALDEKCRTLEF